MKKLLSLLAMLLPLAAFAAKVPLFEVDGVYYEGDYNETTKEGIAYVMPRPDQTPYTGSFIYKSVVEYNGKKFNVIGCSAYNSLDAEEFTIESGFTVNVANVRLDTDKSLRKINMHMFTDWSYNGTWTISTGNNPNCVYVYLRNHGDYTEVVIDKFEVYGPDGKQLTPFICNPDRNGERRFYPDENGVIRLGANFKDPEMAADDMNNYLGILPLSTAAGYTIVLLAAEYEGKRCIIRTQPLHGQTDITATVDNVKYALDNNEALIAEWPDSNDAVIPETIEVDGKQIPVTRIKTDAFKNSEITSVELPASITTVQSNAFDGCNNLTEVTIKGTPIFGYGAFINCENLESVRVAAPYNASHPFINCPKLISTEIVSFPSEDTQSRAANDVVVSVKANLFDLDGNQLPLYARTLSTEQNLPVENGIVSIDKSLLYSVLSNGKLSWSGYIYFNWQDTADSLFSFRVPEDYSSVESVETENTEVVRYFNLQGMPVASPRPGNIYIRCQGNKTSKVLIR